MKKTLLVFILLFLLIVSLSGQTDLQDPAKLIANAGDTKTFPNASHILVYDKTDIKMMDSGLSHVTKKELYKVLTVKGAKELKSLIFGYDPQSAYIEVREAKIIKKCGKTITLSPKTVMDYPAPARMIYWGAREKILPVGRLEPGDGLYVETYQKGFTYALLYQQPQDDSKYIPPMKGHFYDIVPFYDDIPINLKTYQVSIPSNKQLQFEFYNGEARHFAHIEGDRTVYFWSKKDIRPIEEEKRMVNSSDFAPKLLLSTSPDWKTKSLWFHKVNEDFGSFEYDDAIKNKVDEIVKGAKDDMDKISRLTHWVAEEIRYSGISMGEGEGFTLHKGTMTFTDRCGVCKDKAGMLITMLRAAGYESYPAMTMAGSRIDRIPADQFNHCVTLVKLNDKYTLLDPTWVPGVRELWSSAEQQQEYLMGVPEGADLNSTPISPPGNHYLKFNIKSTVSANGDLTATINISAEGQTDSQFRRLIKRKPIPSWEHVIKSEFTKIHPETTVTNLAYSNPYDLSLPMEISARVTVPGYLIKGKKESCFTPISSRLPFNTVLSFRQLETDLKERKFPFRTRCSQLVEINETIKLPGKMKLVTPVKLKQVNGCGADFSGKITQKGSSVLINKTITMKKRIYQPGDWQSVRNSILQFKQPTGDILVIK